MSNLLSNSEMGWMFSKGTKRNQQAHTHSHSRTRILDQTRTARDPYSTPKGQADQKCRSRVSPLVSPGSSLTPESVKDKSVAQEGSLSVNVVSSGYCKKEKRIIRRTN